MRKLLTSLVARLLTTREFKVVEDPDHPGYFKRVDKDAPEPPPTVITEEDWARFDAWRATL